MNPIKKTQPCMNWNLPSWHTGVACTNTANFNGRTSFFFLFLHKSRQTNWRINVDQQQQQFCHFDWRKLHDDGCANGCLGKKACGGMGYLANGSGGTPCMKKSLLVLTEYLNPLLVLVGSLKKNVLRKKFAKRPSEGKSF